MNSERLPGLHELWGYVDGEVTYRLYGAKAVVTGPRRQVTALFKDIAGADLGEGAGSRVMMALSHEFGRVSAFQPFEPNPNSPSGYYEYPSLTVVLFHEMSEMGLFERLVDLLLKRLSRFGVGWMFDAHAEVPKSLGDAYENVTLEGLDDTTFFRFLDVGRAHVLDLRIKGRGNDLGDTVRIDGKGHIVVVALSTEVARQLVDRLSVLASAVGLRAGPAAP